MNYRPIFSLTFLAGALAGGTLIWAQSADKKDAAAASPAEAQLAAAREVFDLDARRHAAGFGGDQTNVEFQHTWSVRLMEAERDTASADGAPAARRQALQHHLDRMRARAKITEDLHSVGQADKIDAIACRYFVAEAERWMQEAERK
jgi:hypothetical protein